MEKYTVVGGYSCTLYGPASLNECRAWLRGYTKGDRTMGGWLWIDIHHIEEGIVESCINTHVEEEEM